MSAEDAVNLLSALEAAGVDIWLDGGWAVDAALETKTRPHDDLDVIVELRHVKTVRDVLESRGYTNSRGEPPQSFELVDRDRRQVDVHPVVFSESGDGLYRMDDGEDWQYPAAGFEGTGRIRGREVRCLTPEIQILYHTGYEPRRKSYDDVTALGKRFGLPVPAEYRGSRDSYHIREQ
jgi:lincosamide nucleotidyltransferase A/C/D/E